MTMPVPHFPDTCRRQRDREHRSAARSGSGLYVPSVLPQNRLADAQAQQGPTPRPLRRIEGIKDAGQSLRRDARAIIVERSRDRFVILSKADAQGATVAHL